MEECYKIENKNKCHYIDNDTWRFLDKNVVAPNDDICALFIESNDNYKSISEEITNNIYLAIKKYVADNKPDVVHKCDEKFVIPLKLPYQYGMYDVTIHLFHETGKKHFHTNELSDTSINLKWTNGNLNVSNIVEISCNNTYTNLYNNLKERLKPHLQRLYYNYILFNDVSGDNLLQNDYTKNVNIINELFIIDGLQVMENNEILENETFVEYFGKSNLKKYIEKYLKLLKYIFILDKFANSKYEINIQNIINMSFNNIDNHIKELKNDFERMSNVYKKTIPYFRDSDITSSPSFFERGHRRYDKKYQDIYVDNGLCKMYNPFPEDIDNRVEAFRDLLRSDIVISGSTRFPQYFWY